MTQAFRLRAIMKQGTAASLPETWTHYPSVQAARAGAKVMYHNDLLLPLAWIAVRVLECPLIAPMASGNPNTFASPLGFPVWVSVSGRRESFSDLTETLRWQAVRTIDSFPDYDRLCRVSRCPCHAR